MNYQQQIKLRAWLRRPLWTYAFLGITDSSLPHDGIISAT